MDIKDYKRLLDVSDENASYVNIDWNIKGFRKKLRRWLRKWHRPYNTNLKSYIRKRKNK